jgi:hypothetical protein
MSVFESLQRPYSHNYSYKNAFLQALFFGAFVFGFLYFFEAFRINEMPYNTLLVCLAFGAITTGVMLIMNLLVPIFFPLFFEEENWTVAKHIVYTVLHVFLIAVCNFLFFIFLIEVVNVFKVFIWFQVITLAVAVFPVSFLTLYREKKERNYFTESANTLTTNNSTSNESKLSKISIVGQNASEKIELNTNQFLFAKADDNYVELYYFKEGNLEKSIFRSTLKDIDNQLKDIDFIFRCHKSFLVNTHNVSRISGNAQGYRLHFKNTDVSAPVSRNQNEWLKNRFAVHPERE